MKGNERKQDRTLGIFNYILGADRGIQIRERATDGKIQRDGNNQHMGLMGEYSLLRSNLKEFW